jgi:hypothetical protein
MTLAMKMPAIAMAGGTSTPASAAI